MMAIFLLSLLAGQAHAADMPDDRKMVVEAKPDRAMGQIPKQFAPNSSPEYYKQDRIPFMTRTPHSGDKGTFAVKYTEASDTTLTLYVRHPKSGAWRANAAAAATTADALSANGANCSAGNYPLGVDEVGAAESCTAAADAFLSANQTFTGANTFGGLTTHTSSITLGPQAYTSTATYASVIRNGWSVVASTSPSYATEAYFTGLEAGRYRLEWNYTHNGSDGRSYVRFNNDGTAGRHKYVSMGKDSTSSGDVGNASNSATSCILGGAAPQSTGQQTMGQYEFEATGSGGTAPGFYQMMWLDNNAYANAVQGACRYGGDPVTSIVFGVTAGSMAGTSPTLILWRRILP